MRVPHPGGVEVSQDRFGRKPFVDREAGASMEAGLKILGAHLLLKKILKRCACELSESAVFKKFNRNVADEDRWPAFTSQV